MKNRIVKKILRIILLTIVGAAVIGTFYFLWKKAQPVITVYEVVTPKRDTVETKTVATGSVEPRYEVEIKPQISGIISELRKEAGQMVQAGEIIATIKVIPEMVQLNSAESRVNIADISLKQVEETYKRDELLFKQGVIAQEDFDLSKANYLKAVEEKANAQSALEIIRDGIAKNSNVASTTQIRSTITGMILDIPVKVGNSVIQANNFNDGTTIATVANMNDMIFKGNVDETEIGRIHEGMPIKLTIGAMESRSFEALLEYVSPKGVEKNGAIQFEIKAAVTIPEDAFIRAGYSANAEIVLKRAEDVLTIPESTVEFQGDSAFVQLVKQEQPEQVFEKHPVKVGLSDGIKIEVQEGLAATDKVRDAVKQWSLEECIQYAIEHNIDLKQKEQEQESRKVDLHTSKYSWLPALNGSLGQSFQFGRSTSKSGVIVDQNAANSTLGINLDMPLFDGLKIPNDIAARKLDLKASIENLNKAREDLSINIASYYLQVLYNKELLKIAQLQVELDKEQVNKTEAMVNAGKVPLSQLYDIKAQLAKDEVTLTESQNNVNLALLDLAQSLELERSDRSFDIQTPVIEDAVADNMSSILPPENIYDHAVTFKPQIKEQQYLLESQKKMLRVAQAGYYPKLNFGASYSNGYYHSTSGGEFADTRSFSEQFKQNGQKIVGFSLSIPLFNRFQVRNSVRTARINIINRELLMENTKKTLYKEIQQAYYNATASQEKYTASDKSVTASKEAFNYAQERYNAGKSTVFEFNEAKTKYAQSLAEQAQAKYDFIFRTKILDFYNGNPIRL